ncbi:NAD(P)-dependent dehydrogenase (short-subunit alcohol dehydrogenase family) [Paenarthrobacter nicotinovorans]|uniref:SDR family NAD(P)-dependent oxidoreductase n=1 Tax=Micrococcaceae TaxID=1268 RepID=UPI000877394D|nr:MULTISPECIES: SDR family NAD(P)-dependent oxidoreductase [Micrococcaceae]MDR6436774.1 NAD(P)-dependent dehydrogenase (short-subunit alcohol dehydrogenase family) [Paenarthrobacter nicotinovorans]SCZ56655.1 NADP-dependent 3-hydroxy acid dehydrogenase YdfG [Arthrobacter sp. UNCCL28]
MKTTIAIVGAGPGLGLASARRFGAEGFNVALLSRAQEHVDALASDLTDAGITARGYAADVRDDESLRSALARAAKDLAPVEILHYSPVPSPNYLRPVLETTLEEFRSALDFSVLGAAAAVNSVLPGMRALGRGTALFINGSSAVRPNHRYAGTSAAFAAESAYAHMLHEALAPEGIYVAQLIVPLGIGGGDPAHEPAALAETLWRLYRAGEDFRTFVKPYA